MRPGELKQTDIACEGLRASVVNAGAALFELSLPLPAGRRSTILRHSRPEAYLSNRHYLGAIAGRCANRIRDGEARIGGVVHQLDRNEGGVTHLHGGSNGFSRRLWSVNGHGESWVELGLFSEHGDQGYPGNASVTCRYDALPGLLLRITLTATSDRDTLMNLAAHSYFNLEPGSSALDHSLQIGADRYTPTDDRLIPDGRILPVAGTGFDFRSLARLGDKRRLTPGGFDHNMVLAAGRRADPQPCATLVSPSGDLAMDIATTEPGLQLYDGQKLSPEPADPLSQLRPFAGCCLEPQRFPDAVHHPQFAQSFLMAGEIYRQVTEYRFRPLPAGA
jgi:aldose 1-epimerase